MIRLHASDKKLQAFLAGAAATTNPTVTVSFYDVANKEKPDFSEYRGGMQYTVLAGATETDVCAAPPDNGTVRNIDHMTVYNADTAAVVVSVCVDDGGTNRILVKQTLNVAETLGYSAQMGWYII